MALEFDALLESLHQNTSETNLVESESNPIVVNNKRQFVVPTDYNTVIAYEGDVNSQLITFELPVKHEGHNLSNCSIKKLYWKNLSSGIEGIADLTQLSADSEKQLLQWAVPPEAFSQAGTLELSISIQDIYNGIIGFAWNTATFSSLTIAETMNSMSTIFPPRDEILTIDEETRQIIAPIGYNNVAAFQGDVGIGKVYFLVKRYIKNIDLMSSDIKLHYQADNLVKTSKLSKIEYTPELQNRYQEGMVLLTWNMPDGENELIQTYYGPLIISLEISSGSKKWHTETYSNLEIRPSFTPLQNNDNPEIDEYLSKNKWTINGNDVINGNDTTSISGVVSLRNLDSPTNSSLGLVLNEILPYYDAEGNLINIYLNTPKGLVAIGGFTPTPDEPEEPDDPDEPDTPTENYAKYNDEYMLYNDEKLIIA